MPKTATAPVEPAPPAAAAKFSLLPLDQVDESPRNPRKQFDKVALAELAESIRSHGVIEPVLVRPKGDRFEAVFGNRRLRASKLAGRIDVPAIVRELSDVEALEAAVIENLQRQDVHPLEEAEGYEQLLAQKEKAYTVDDIAAKVGKSKGYVYGRLKLTELCPDARKAFYHGTFSASVALLVARMPADLQVKALKELGRYTPGDGPISFRQAADVIHRSFMLDLKGAGFPTGVADLVPAAGACTTCPKRSGANPDLFGDVESGDVCSDPTCFRAKTEAVAAVKVAEAKAAGRTILDAKEAKKVLEPTYGRGPASPKYDAPYVTLDATCHQDPKYRSYRKLLGKRAAEAVVLAPDDGGHLVELLPKDGIRKLLKEAGHDFKKARGAGSGAMTEEEKAAAARAREKDQVDGLVEERVAALFGLALDQKEPSREVWDAALDTVIDGASYAGDISEPLQRRFGADDPVQAFEKARPKMTAAQLRAALLDLLLGYELGAFRGKKRAPVLAWARIDVKKIEAEVKAERKKQAEQLIEWAAEPNQKGRIVGKSKTGGRIYHVWKGQYGWEMERPGTGVGCGGAGPFTTTEKAQEKAEERERESFGPPEKKKGKGAARG